MGGSCVQDLIISPEQRRNQDLLLSYGLRSLSALFLKLKYPYYNSEISVVRSPKTGWAIRLRLVENLRLTPSIFTCKTLVVLKLSGLLVDSVSSVDLPLLKTLHLMEVFFKKRKDLMMLLSGCPLLEDLNAPTVSHLQNDCILGFRNLPNLVKANLRALHVPFTILYNARFLRLDWVCI
ncbi:putative F-box/FBD/LRR-repeat protein At3g56780 [Lotus japonicus]|uniref:putative F-box/FBD/LRR-repeat protein At3g56780 n=1 Tax=Lotus japonicus TaxID=34305 RepID=UPI002587344E|nr:putative F-box/FBD/LRR-repeat protein At3g56780 [Lotus japonicus]